MIRFDNLMVPHISDTFKLRCCPFIHLIGFRRFSSTKRWKTRSSCATGCLDDAGLEGTGQLGDGHDGIQHALDGRNARELSTGSFSVLDASLQTLLIDKMKKQKEKRFISVGRRLGSVRMGPDHVANLNCNWPPKMESWAIERVGRTFCVPGTADWIAQGRPL